MAEFLIFVQKMPEFYMIIARKYFPQCWGTAVHSHALVSYAHGHNTQVNDSVNEYSLISSSSLPSPTVTAF